MATRSSIKKNNSNSTSSLKVVLFNVGQGDHVLIELPNGEFGIIDFYYGGPLNLTRPPALDYLEHLQKTEPHRQIVIAFLCISHPDQDHVKGIDKFLSWIAIKSIQLKCVWLFAGTRLSQLLDNYQEFADSSDSRVAKYKADAVTRNLRQLQEFVEDKRWNGRPEYLHDIRLLGRNIGGVRVLSIAPLSEHIKKFDKQGFHDFVRHINDERKRPTAQKNLVSSVLFMLFKEHRLLFGGDTGEKVWSECLRRYEDIGLTGDHGECRGNFIKVSHHGSKHSSSLALWSKLLGPGQSYAGISAGQHAEYNHPHPETLRHIHSAAKQNGTKASVFTTNCCNKCLAKQEVHTRSGAWTKGRRPRLNPSVDEVLRRERPIQRRLDSKSPSLAAYEFEFHSDNTATVTQHLTAADGGRVQGSKAFNKLVCPTCLS